jgi:translation initiation factor IF-2
MEHFEPIAAPVKPAVTEPVAVAPPPAPVVVEAPPPPPPPPVVEVKVAPPPPVVVAPPPPPPPVMQAKHVPPPANTPRQPVTPPPAATPSTPPRRPSSPPKTGIEVWQGRAGVPMPAVRTGPPARRTTYDPRAAAPAPRIGGPTFGPPNRGGGGPNNRNNRPNFRPRPGMGGPLNRKPAMVSTQEMSSHKKVIKIEEQVTLQQLAGKMSLKSTDVLMRLLSMGMPGVNINSTLDAETAKILASEFGWAVEDVAVSETDAITAAMGGATDDTDAELEVRPPIVTVMGHVDHGKTSLLDRIRKATVADGEAGGITQHVGAYRVETAKGTIAFLDTPGHEAFTAMRARGASVTDIVILVVAADDGVMPQTKEAINHAQAAKVPIIVAVNKIDKPGADPEKIKRDLASLGLQPEEWGGETMFVHVSAKTGEGIEHLLETVLLQAEVLELTASPKRRASGTVIEALLDRGRGPVARVMIQDGTLRTGDVLLAGGAWGKVRAMTDELGRPVLEAGPATPVEVLGLNEVPSAGDPVHAVKDAKTAEEIAETRRKKASKTLIPQDSRVSLETLTKNLSEADQLELKLIIKGDVQGSVEAVGHALAKLTTPKVKVTIVHAAVGAITEGDVNLAVASKAIIAGFNVRPAGKSAALAENEGVEIRLYNIIYNAIDDIRSAMEGLLPATKVEKILGRAEVRQVFNLTKIGIVAGCMVTNGLVRRTGEARLIRENIVVWTGKLSGVRRFKDDVKEVAEGFECGISLDGYTDIKQNDFIESFEVEEIKTKL